jgi:hypothetical protein
MSDLNSRERAKLELLLGMGGGYVLDFSNRTFGAFFQEFVGRDIYDPRYGVNGSSKANHLRAFWIQEPNAMVARCLRELIEHARETRTLSKDVRLVEDCQAIIRRLETVKPVADIEAISADISERDFELLAKAASESIDKGEPELGLDRLHTFVVKFMRKRCEERHLPVDRDTPLNGLVGAYVKDLGAKGQLGSNMAERILKSSIAILEQFNHVRNNQTLAHDNPVLSYDEAILIFNHVASTIRFIKALEQRLAVAAAVQQPSDDLPF